MGDKTWIVSKSLEADMAPRREKSVGLSIRESEAASVVVGAAVQVAVQVMVRMWQAEELYASHGFILYKGAQCDWVHSERESFVLTYSLSWLVET